MSPNSPILRKDILGQELLAMPLTLTFSDRERGLNVPQLTSGTCIQGPVI